MGRKGFFRRPRSREWMTRPMHGFPHGTALLVAMLFGALLFFSDDASAGSPIAGKTIWETKSCPRCHGIDGRPLLPGVPNFARGDGLYKPDRALIMSMYKGSGVMPALRGILTEKDLANVMTYIRTLQR